MPDGQEKSAKWARKKGQMGKQVCNMGKQDVPDRQIRRVIRAKLKTKWVESHTG